MFKAFKFKLILIDEQERQKLKYILYGEMIVFDKCHLRSDKFLFNKNFLDDMCHLAPYAKNLVAKHDTEMTRYFSELRMAVDFLHFKVESPVKSIIHISTFFVRIMLGRTARSSTLLTSTLTYSLSILWFVNNR